MCDSRQTGSEAHVRNFEPKGDEKKTWLSDGNELSNQNKNHKLAIYANMQKATYVKCGVRKRCEQQWNIPAPSLNLCLSRLQ